MRGGKFGLLETAFDERTRLIAVHGPLDGARFRRVMSAVEAAQDQPLVVDLTCAAVEGEMALAVLEGLAVLRGIRRTVLIARQRDFWDATVPGRITLVSGEAAARAALSPIVASWDVRLWDVTVAACVQVCGTDGVMRCVGTSARWEARTYPELDDAGTTEGLPWMAYVYRRPATLLVLVVDDGASEVAAIDAHLISAMEPWVGDQVGGDGLDRGAVGVTVVLGI